MKGHRLIMKVLGRLLLGKRLFGYVTQTTFNWGSQSIRSGSPNHASIHVKRTWPEKIALELGVAIVSFRILSFRVFSCFVYSKVKPVSARY